MRCTQPLIQTTPVEGVQTTYFCGVLGLFGTDRCGVHTPGIIDVEGVEETPLDRVRFSEAYARMKLSFTIGLDPDLTKDGSLTRGIGPS